MPWILGSTLAPKTTASLVSQGAALSLSSWLFERHEVRCGAGLGFGAPVSTFLPDKLNETSRWKRQRVSQKVWFYLLRLLFFDPLSLTRWKLYAEFARALPKIISSLQPSSVFSGIAWQWWKLARNSGEYCTSLRANQTWTQCRVDHMHPMHPMHLACAPITVSV